MLGENATIKLVSKLMQLTNAGELTWETNTTPIKDLDASQVQNGYTYNCTYKDYILRLYRYNEKHYTDIDEYLESTVIMLSIIDARGMTLYDLPYVRAIDDLYNIVRFKSVNLDKLLNDL